MMKRRYQIIRTAGQPDWAAAPRAQIDQLLWTPQTQITAYAQLVCGDDRLFVHLHADEDAAVLPETLARLPLPDAPCSVVLSGCAPRSPAALDALRTLQRASMTA